MTDPLITKPGVYENVPADAYHADPCLVPSLSCSLAQKLDRHSPRHAWTASPRLNPAWGPEDKTKFSFGTAGHAVLLRDPHAFVIVDAKDWKKNDAKAQRDEAFAAGKTPLLREQWDRIQIMVAEARKQLAEHEDCPHAFRPDRGRSELTLVWTEGDVWLRIRIDWLSDDNEPFDAKCTDANANPEAYQRTFFGADYDFRAAFYLRGIRKLGLDRGHPYRVVPIETEPPFALSVVAPSDDAVMLAEKRVERAIARWRYCLRENSWPGYPSRTAYLSPPAWREHQQMEREIREEADPQAIARAMDWQRPLDWEAAE